MIERQRGAHNPENDLENLATPAFSPIKAQSTPFLDPEDDAVKIKEFSPLYLTLLETEGLKDTSRISQIIQHRFEPHNIHLLVANAPHPTREK